MSGRAQSRPKINSLLLNLVEITMSTIRITKHFDFETAHALYGYDGKCKNIHGHSYQLYVTIIGRAYQRC